MHWIDALGACPKETVMHTLRRHVYISRSRKAQEDSNMTGWKVGTRVGITPDEYPKCACHLEKIVS